MTLRLIRLVIGPFVALALLAATASAAPASEPLKAPPATVPIFGYIQSITKVGAGYQVSFDPAYLLTGFAAKKAGAADGQSDVGDYYVRNPEHSLLTFKIAGSARATVVTFGNAPVTSTAVTIAELARIVAGQNPQHLHLSAGKLGYWVTTKYDVVTALDQQYLP